MNESRFLFFLREKNLLIIDLKIDIKPVEQLSLQPTQQILSHLYV